MTIEIINGIRVITPTEGHWLYNKEVQVISDRVFLGINAPENDWTEITEERKAELEALWELENDPENSAIESDFANNPKNLE